MSAPEEAVPDLYRLAFVPGLFRCPECQFVLSRTTLNVATGNMGTTEDDRQSAPCPNDGTLMEHVSWKEQASTLQDRLSEVLALINTPEIEDFDKAVPLEAVHQVYRWGSDHDSGKAPEDWFWLLGYLSGKALSSLKAGDIDKAKHHCISSAATLRNWHAHIRSGQSLMRPGIAAKKEIPQ